MQVVVLAGGRGTRMGPLARDIPKPMVPVAGKPILQHQLELARRYGADEAILLTGHLGQVIEEHFGDAAAWGMPIRCHRETAALGTAGALKDIKDWLDDDFLVFYGDTIMDLDLARLWQFHRERRRAGHAGRPSQQPSLRQRPAGRRRRWPHHGLSSQAAQRRDACYRNLANAALYVLNRRLLEQVAKGQPADLGRDIFPAVLRAGGVLAAYNTCEYIADAGTWTACAASRPTCSPEKSPG